MDDELVLLTSYFNLAGGRIQDDATTFRVEMSLPSATSPDGVAALFVVTESTTGGHMGPRARRLAVDAIVDGYAAHGEIPPATRLKAALKASHEVIHEEFEGHVSVGAGVIAVESDTIYLAQAGPSQVFVVHEGGLNAIDPAVDPRQPFARALGSSTGPKISVFRDQLVTGDIFALTSSVLTSGPNQQDVHDCFGAGTSDEIGESLLRVVRDASVRDCTVIVFEATLASEVPPEEDEEPPAGFIEQVDGAVASLAGVGRMLWREFRAVPPDEPSEDSPYGVRRRPNAQASTPDLVAEPAPPATGLGGSFRDDSTMEIPAISWETTAPDESAPAPAAGDDQPAARTYSYREQPTEEMPAISPDDFPSDDFSAVDLAQDDPVVPSDTRDLDGSRDNSDLAARQERELEEIRRRRGRRRSAHSIIRQGRRRDAELDSAADPEPQVESRPAYRTELEQVNARIHSDPDIGDAVPPVQTFPDTSTEPSRIYATSKDIQAVNRRPRRFGGVARPIGDPLSGTPVIRPNNLGDIDLRRSVRRPVSGPLVWAGVVACFLLFVVALVLFVNHRKQPVAVNQYPALVRRDIAAAQAARTPSVQDAYLAKASHNLQLAATHGSTATYVTTMRGQILSTTDLLHHITRVASPLVLTDFSKFPGAHPTAIATGPGLVFVLDSGRKSVFSVTPNATSNPVQVVQDGESDSGFTIGMPELITTAGATALTFDNHNVLVRANGASKTATSLTAGAQNQKVAAIANTGPDVYLLDTGSDQLWRYPYGVAGFNPSPQAFFTSDKPDLTKARSFVFDSTSLYVLDDTNAVHKYDIDTANPQPFVVHARTPLKGATQVFTDAGLNYVWVADPASGRIVQLDKSGNYVRTYVSGSPAMRLRQISSVAVGPNGHTLYVLIGAKVFDFPVLP